MIAVDISEIRRVPASFRELAGTLQNEIVSDAVSDYLVNVQEDAQSNHRYKRRTGNLERSIKIRNKPDGGMVYINEAQAPYGKFVHDGQRSWAPDQFLYNAAIKNEPELNRKIDQAVDKAFRKAGL